MTSHVLDEASFMTIGAGQTRYPVYVGTPRCACGAEWTDDRCSIRGTFFGQAWEAGILVGEVVATQESFANGVPL